MSAASAVALMASPSPTVLTGLWHTATGARRNARGPTDDCHSQVTTGSDGVTTASLHPPLLHVLLFVVFCDLLPLALLHVSPALGSAVVKRRGAMMLMASGLTSEAFSRHASVVAATAPADTAPSPPLHTGFPLATESLQYATM